MRPQKCLSMAPPLLLLVITSLATLASSTPYVGRRELVRACLTLRCFPLQNSRPHTHHQPHPEQSLPVSPPSLSSPCELSTSRARDSRRRTLEPRLHDAVLPTPPVSDTCTPHTCMHCVQWCSEFDKQLEHHRTARPHRQQDLCRMRYVQGLRRNERRALGQRVPNKVAPERHRCHGQGRDMFM